MLTLKRLSPWIACLALLLNMRVMPMSRAMQTPDVQLMLWGGFCSGGSSQTLPASLSQRLDTLPTPAEKSVMQHGKCCCGHAGLAALPGDYYRHHLPRYTADIAFDNPPLPTLHPRVRWPSLTPRASPTA